MKKATTFHLRWREIENKGHWQCCLLPLPDFPLPTLYNEAVGSFCELLARQLIEIHHLHHHVLLQTWKLGPDTGARTLSAHRRAWRPQLGLGIWPDREPPQGWTEERMVDAAAAVYRGDEPEMPSHRLLRLSAPSTELVPAARAMRGTGTLVEIFSRNNSAEMDARCLETFHPRIQEHRFRHEAFYAPLADQNTFVRAESPEALDQDLCGAEVYLRESPEDKALLLLSRAPIAALLSGNTESLPAE